MTGGVARSLSRVLHAVRAAAGALGRLGHPLRATLWFMLGQAR